MKQEAPWICDGPGCGQTKGPANRWWILEMETGHEMLLKIWPWDDARANYTGAKHFCSESCVNKAVSKWLEMAA
jgi:hypothetical protein